MNFFSYRYKTKVDNLWTKTSKIIRELHPFCAYCRKTETLQVHHIKGRRKLSLKYYPPNLIVLCSSCHVFSSEFSAHGTPKEFMKWVKETNPSRLDKIALRENTTFTQEEAKKMWELEIKPLKK